MDNPFNILIPSKRIRSAGGSGLVNRVAYFSGTNILSGTSGFTFVTSTLSVPGKILNGAGNVSAPAYSFTDDSNTGVYSRGADEIGFAAAGADKFIIQSSAVISSVKHAFQDGAIGAPGIFFDSDSNCGLYRSGTDAIALVTGGVAGVAISSTQAVTLGTGTSAIHRLNTALATNGADAATLLNGPGGTAGNPDIWVKLNVNGTDYCFPAWTFT